VLSVLSGMVVAAVRGLPLQDVLGAFVQGCQAMTIGAIVLALAVTLGTVAKELHTGDYIATTVGTWLPVWAIPAVLTFVTMGVAFSTGSSWGTFAVVFPAVLPAPSDLSTVFASTDATVFENFATPSTFDLMNNGLQFLPTSPGWAVVPLGPPTGCAEVLSYGTGCIEEFASFYEEFATAVALINQQLVDLKPLVSATLPYRDAGRAFALAADRTQSMKVLLDFE